jgi:hypothetical protein
MSSPEGGRELHSPVEGSGLVDRGAIRLYVAGVTAREVLGELSLIPLARAGEGHTDVLALAVLHPPEGFEF